MIHKVLVLLILLLINSCYLRQKLNKPIRLTYHNKDIAVEINLTKWSKRDLLWNQSILKYSGATG
jgi:hypothetical protein